MATLHLHRRKASEGGRDGLEGLQREERERVIIKVVGLVVANSW